MPNAQVRLAIGPIDGTNVVFYTPVPYVPSSTAYIINGRTYSSLAPRGSFNPYGYFESNPDVGQITLDFPPQPGDVVQILFSDRQPSPTPPQVQISGSVSVNSGIVGTVRGQ
jgi:hypothetical protein